MGFNLSWELDFWGRFRRAVTAAEHSLEASCANYNQVLVTLLGDVASNYVQVRTLQQRIEYVRANVALQARLLAVAERRLKAGSKSAVDCHQARSNLAQTEAQIPQLKLAMRQACDRLCVLLGQSPTALEKELGVGPIPSASAVIAIGIPADLLRRRPDVQRAERLALAQGEQIGIAEAELYPMFAINGTIGVESDRLSQLLTSSALTGNIGPVFQWNILNYGRIRNNMRMQEARFQARVAAYQETVLRANAEAEDGLAMFFSAQERTLMLLTKRGQRAPGGRAHCQGLSERSGRFQPRGADRAEPGPAARPAGPIARRDRPGIDPSVPGPGRRLASSARRGTGGPGSFGPASSCAARYFRTAHGSAPAAVVGNASGARPPELKRLALPSLADFHS